VIVTSFVAAKSISTVGAVSTSMVVVEVSTAADAAKPLYNTVFHEAAAAKTAAVLFREDRAEQVLGPD
jgi:hypothetical protein